MADYRELHQRSGCRDPYAYWLQQQWVEFRWLHGLKVVPRSKEEQQAFDAWITERWG